ncbi:MAG TPA: rhomboid family intramembrane serine protease [Nocardioidaceae bacterium]|nr:rhomboid family intramembrane serine protease [Nocardioidaceae bacterium]
MSTETAPYCYRHPDRETHISCQRCGRPICPDCMNQAAVGFQCPSCVQEGRKSTRSGRLAYGGKPSGDPTLTSKVLIAANAAVWLLITATGGGTSVWIERLALFPVGQCWFGPRLPPGVSEEQCLASGGDWIEGVASGAWWQLGTSMFTHVELLHIGFNMLALWFLGPQLEAALGRLRFLAIYLISGLTGSAFVYWLTPEFTPTVGASGAIFGLMGALLVVAFKIRADYSQILLWLGLNVMITIFGRGLISWQGHLGGLVGGVLLALVMVYSPRSRRPVWQAIGVTLVAVAFLVAVTTRTLVLV